MINDFLSWAKLVQRQYTDHIYYDTNNTFTFNYRGTRYTNSEVAPGWWREVYRYAYDTDRLHTHPWEMLGFTIKPKWWEEKYGEAILHAITGLCGKISRSCINSCFKI